MIQPLKVFRTKNGELGKWMPALITAPFELLQSAVGTVIAITLCYSLKLRDKLKLDI